MNCSMGSKPRHTLLLSVCALFHILVTFGVSHALEVVDHWRYVQREPPKSWSSTGFDDSSWSSGNGGFGTSGTPGARIGTFWASSDIWLRKSYNLDSAPKRPALLIHHDEDVEVYINGKQVLDLKGFQRQYKLVPIPEDKLSAVKIGNNTLAVHCRHTNGGQFIDVHLVEAADVPTLPEPKKPTKPFQSRLITEWGETVSSENVWTQYPRPHLKRPQWSNLNGKWQYAITPGGQPEIPQNWDGEILVPFCLESKLGGVQRLLDPTEALWYRRTFSTNRDPSKQRLLHFEAVDYSCEVFVNGSLVGTHQGGNSPFSFNITDALKNGENELIVRVEDKNGGFQLGGKQSLHPRGIWYTQVSGIWQTVWTEEVPIDHISDLKISTDPGDGIITVAPAIEGAGSLHVVVRDGQRNVVEGTTSEQKISLTVPNARLWSPDDPHLYELEIELIDGDGKIQDSVTSYAGIRSVEKLRDRDGHLRLALNGEEIFHWGTLDQGWWPDGLLTPPSDEAMLFDIRWLKEAGFNMIRKHVKVESRRYYYHCDRIGMLVWQDHVNTRSGSPPWTRNEPGPRDGRWPQQHHDQFMLELERMIDTLEHHPSVVVWVPFNERWGQHRTMRVGNWLSDRDPTRLVNIASGGNFWPTGDLVDAHSYPHPGFPFSQAFAGRFNDYIKVVGEFGGHGYPVEGHLWDSNRDNWGYGGLPKDKDEFIDRYSKSVEKLVELRKQGIAGGVYTQTTDVEGEINGLLTYDRKVSKISAQELAKLHRSLLSQGDDGTTRTTHRELYKEGAPN